MTQNSLGMHELFTYITKEYVSPSKFHHCGFFAHLQVTFDRMPVNQKPHYVYKSPCPFHNDKPVSDKLPSPLCKDVTDKPVTFY